MCLRVPFHVLQIFVYVSCWFVPFLLVRSFSDTCSILVWRMPCGPIGRHLSALGRFGETAFIAPLYGVGELSQSFCRMAAVYGAVYVLRRQLKGAVVDRVTKR